MQYRIVFTAVAREQISEISHYIAYQLYAPDSAERFLSAIEKAAVSLAQLPHRVPLTTEQPWHDKGIRKLIVKQYFVYFRIVEETSTVQILAVVYGRRDQKRFLSELQFDS